MPSGLYGANGFRSNYTCMQLERPSGYVDAAMLHVPDPADSRSISRNGKVQVKTKVATWERQEVTNWPSWMLGNPVQTIMSLLCLRLPCHYAKAPVSRQPIYKACTCLLDLKSALDLGPGHQAEFELRISTLHLVSVVRAMCFLMGIECLYGSAD